MLGCQKKEAAYDASNDTESNLSESAVAVMGSIANDTESIAPGFVSEERESPLAIGTTNSYAACSFLSARSGCSANVSTVNWNSCSIGTAKLSGGWTNEYNSASTCSTAQSSALPSGGSVTRSSASGLLVTYPGGATLTTDTQSHVTYNSFVIPSTGITTMNSGGVRSVTIGGLRRILRGPGGGKWFDHSLTGNLTVAGARATNNRVVNGSITLYHNLAHITATHTFNSVTWGQSSCAFPTGGYVQTSLSTGESLRLTYTSTCGTATFTSTTGITTGLTLTMTE
jgi:hypothetical protein